MKVLYVCDECKDVHKYEAESLILVNSSKGMVRIVGKQYTPVESWDILIHQLPEMVRHDCPPSLTG